jgi:hypothetical protein
MSIAHGHVAMLLEKLIKASEATRGSGDGQLATMLDEPGAS